MTAATGTAGGRIAAAFAQARAERRAALIPFVTAGDPDLQSTQKIVQALGRAGADIVEIGVPFSDPIADGSVIQRSAERAIKNGVGLRATLALMGSLREQGAPPLVLFTYFNPVHRLGVEAFAAGAGRARVDGVLVTDLPPEEAGDLRGALNEHRIDLIHLLAPTSTPERVAAIGREGQGFLYVISRPGVTGAKDDVPEGVAGQVSAARAVSRLPIAVGFGISRPAQVRAVAAYADGVVVGSALVRLIEEAGPSPDLSARVEVFCQALRGACQSAHEGGARSS